MKMKMKMRENSVLCTSNRFLMMSMIQIHFLLNFLEVIVIQMKRFPPLKLMIMMKVEKQIQERIQSLHSLQTDKTKMKVLHVCKKLVWSQLILLKQYGNFYMHLLCVFAPVQDYAGIPLKNVHMIVAIVVAEGKHLNLMHLLGQNTEFI